MPDADQLDARQGGPPGSQDGRPERQDPLPGRGDGPAVAPPGPAGGQPGPRTFEVTSRGRALATVVVVSYVAGVLLGYQLLMILAGAGILALAVGVGFVTWRPKVALTRDFRPRSVTAGRAVTAVMQVTNQSRLPSPPLRVTDRLGTTDVDMAVRVLPVGGTALLRYPLPTERRGRIALGPLRVTRSDPFDLLRRRQPGGGIDALWVHPRTWPLSPLPSGVIVDLEGPVSESAAEGSLTFSSLREYVVGDDRRQIHWRSSARAGKLLVRRNVDANEPYATVVLDTRPAAWVSDDAFESAVEMAASAVSVLATSGHPVDLRLLGRRAGDPKWEGASSHADRLAAVEMEPAATAHGLFALMEAGREGGSLVVVTGRIDTSVEARISRQTRRYAPVVLCCIDPAQPPRWRRRSGIDIVVGPTAPAVAEAWNQLFSS
jgi:uncharacterized protein (DUF58 family)